MNSTRSNSSVSGRQDHSTRGPLQPNDQVLTPKRARHPISSPVTGEPAGARSVNRSRKGPERVSANPPAAAAAEPPTEAPLVSLERGGQPTKTGQRLVRLDSEPASGQITSERRCRAGRFPPRILI